MKNLKELIRISALNLVDSAWRYLTDEKTHRELEDENLGLRYRVEELEHRLGYWEEVM